MLLIIVLVLGLMVWKGCYHPKFPEIATEYLNTYSSVETEDISATPKPCTGRDHCVYVYLAAWCPHCRDLISNIHDFRNYWKAKDRPGLIVIVGNDKQNAIESMARSVGEPVFLDVQDKFRKKFHINFFPYFMVVDSKQQIVATRTDGMQWVDNEINEHLRR